MTKSKLLRSAGTPVSRIKGKQFYFYILYNSITVYNKHI